MNGIPTARFIVGDVFKTMASMPDGSVDMLMTSPPFLRQRSYLPADHPDKDKEIGGERTPQEYLSTLLRLSAEWRRIVAPYGSIVVELGDTYSGSGGAGGDYNPGGWREGQERFAGSGRIHTDTKYERIESGNQGSPIRNLHGRSQPGGDGWPLAKSLAMVPEAYRFALAYGVDPFTGDKHEAGRWRVRNVVRWVRPAPPTGELFDKFRPGTTTLAVACTTKDRWFDLDAVLTPTGAPPLDWWKIHPQGFKGSHYAVYPGELCVTPIKAMCPQKVCRTCGEPSRRIVQLAAGEGGVHQANNGGGPTGTGKGHRSRRTIIDEDWTDCGHDDWRRGIVFDPFAGTGTTLMVATGLDRDAIGIDLDGRNLKLAAQRIGMFLLASPP